jgi:dTDP-4-amino-4,6-dideoxygalactose transaminase
MPDIVCRDLSWDSEFFGLRIARYSSDRLTEESARAAMKYCRERDVDCLYLLLSDAPDSLAVAETSGFTRVDTRLTLAMPLGQGNAPPVSCDIRLATPTDIAALREIAKPSHIATRFYSDAHFTPKQCDALYEAWIERSVYGWAERTLVAEVQGSPAGYITCHLSEAGAGSIGLFAVAESARDSGVGSALIQAALQYFRQAGMHTAEVTTQERNISGLLAYERSGFQVCARQVWYHVWPKIERLPKTACRIPFNQPGIFGLEYEYMADAVARGHISGDGAYTHKCQRLLEVALGVPRVLLTTSCTHALEMCALLLDIQPGDEVIVPSFTFVSTVNAFVLRGARPVFADIRPDTLNLDESQLESLITSRTKAIVVVHYAGVGCEMDAIMSIAARHGIPVVEDNAHGLFGKYKGRRLGTLGQLATQSFHETKNIHCGEGGALLINDPALIQRAEILREKGTNRSAFFRGEVDKYTWVDVGSSYVISDSLAAFLFAQLEARDRIQRARLRVWNSYATSLTAWAMVNGIGLPYVPGDCTQSYHMFYLKMPSCELRQDLIDHLKRRGILSVFHYVPLHSSPMGIKFGGYEGQCPVAERTSDTLLRLPFYGDLTAELQGEVVHAIQEFRVPSRSDRSVLPHLHIPVETLSDSRPAGLANLAQACEDPAESRRQSPANN